MNQCVPSWDIEENPPLHLRVLASKTQSKTNDFLLHDIPTVDFEIAELTWKDGHLGMHGFGVPKLHTKAKENVYSPAPAAAAGSSARCSWDKPLVAGDTLESLVNQATIPSSKSRVDDVVAGVGDEQLVSWFDNRKPPCMPESLPVIATTYLVGSSTLMGSCSGAPTLMEESGGGKEVSRVAAAAARLSRDWSSRVAEQSISGGGSGATRGCRESHQASYDTCEREVGNNTTTGFTFSTTSLGSPGNTTSSAKDGTRTTVDDFDSVCHSQNQGGGDKEEDKKKVTVSGKRSRCAAVHNQSERKRRDKINQRMSILQKLVPNSSKTDKASMLDEVIEYMKQLQGKVEMMNRMNMSSMMLPLALQQQLQMTMMPPMGMGMGIGSMNMGMGINVMDINSMTRPGMAPQGFYPNPYMSMASSWDHMPLQSTSSMTIDPLSNASFLASQSQPSMTMDAYSRMAALYQQQQQFQASAAAAATSNKAI